MSEQGVRMSLPRSGQLSQSAWLGVTTYDLQLRKVITSSFELRLVLLDSMEIPLSQEYIHVLRRIEYVRLRCQTEFTEVRSAQSVSLAGGDYV